MARPLDTIAALATPAGTSAIAVIRVSGPATAALAREVVGTPLPPRQMTRGDYRDRAGVPVDDVVHTFFAAPNSYTGDDAWEVSCHGNPYIAQRILDDLLARGCRLAEPGEFTQRAFLNGRIDLTQAEAVMDLIHARSERALAAANQQLRGSLGRRMEDLIAALLKAIARIEAYIDFPEEDLPPEDRRSAVQAIERIAADTGRLLATNRYGDMLREGIRTVIVGAPNAGKSSVLNRLVGRERALVSAEPGTTRDYLEEPILLGPHRLRLIDTAGLNPTPGRIEKLGIEKAMELAAEADLFLVVIDGASPPPDLPPGLVHRFSDTNTILVLNKSDLPPSPTPLPPALGRFPGLRIAAIDGSGFSAMTDAIVKKADAFGDGSGGETVAINARHAEALARGVEGLRAALAKLGLGAPIELVASDLRDVLSAYGAIAGRVDNERMLDDLFSTFCIGK